MKKEKFVKACLNIPPLPIEDIAAARQIELRRSELAVRINFFGTIDNIAIATEVGSSRLRLYTPQDTDPFPVIHYHYPGQVHDFPLSIKIPDNAKDVTARIGDQLISLLSNHKA